MEVGRFIFPDSIDYMLEADTNTLEQFCTGYNNFPWTRLLFDVVRRFTNPETWRFCNNPPKGWVHRYPVENMVQVSASTRREDAQANVFVEIITPKDHKQRKTELYRDGAMQIHLPFNTTDQITNIFSKDDPGINNLGGLILTQPGLEVFSNFEANAALNYLWLSDVKKYLAQRVSDIGKGFAQADSPRGLTTIIIPSSS